MATRSKSSRLLHYSGDTLSTPGYNQHVPNATSNRYSNDASGQITYRFNSLGFRGEEFNPQAQYHIFVCGPSEGFGVGLDERDIWCYRIKILFARHRNVPPEAVNLLNFSRAGASVDYIVRVTVRGCVRYMLVVARRRQGVSRIMEKSG